MDINENSLKKIQRKEQRLRFLSNLLSIGLIVFGIFWIYYSNKQVEDSKQKVKILKDEEIMLSNIISKKKDSIRNLKIELSEAQGLNFNKKVSRIIEKEYKNQNSDSIQNVVTQKIINENTKTNNYIKDLLKNSDSLSRGKINLRYYAKSNDDEKVEGLLKSLGYNFRKRKTTDPYKNKKNNCLWFGANVHEKDIKIVALTLIRAGVELENIRQFVHYRYGEKYKSNILEVTTCPDMYADGLVSIEDVYSGKAINYFDYETIKK